MKKKIDAFLIIIGLIVFSLTLCAENFKLKEGETSLVIKENTYLKLHIINSLSDISCIKTIKTPKGTFSELIVSDYGHSNLIGYPKLPMLKKLIEIPTDAEIEVNIIGYNVTKYNLGDFGIIYPIIPTQPPLSKGNNRKDTVFRYNAKAYEDNSYTNTSPGLVTVDKIGIMRGICLARLNIAPIQYNPVLNAVKIYNDIEIEIIFKNGNIDKTLSLKKKTNSPYFSAAYSQLINYKKLNKKDTVTKYPVKYVIVADSMFQSTLQPFIQWKTKKGFHVIEAYTNDPAVGKTTTSIKSYLKSLYNSGTVSDPAPSFVLFVGDIAQIQTFAGKTGSHVTDLYYCEYTNDYIPEVFYGRFSATNVSELQSQIDKTLQYEQYLMPDPSFLNEVVMIAGVDAQSSSTYCNGQVNYGTTTYFNLAHGLTSHTYLYPASGSSSSQIIQYVSNGVGFVNYTAHGSAGGWSNPSFSVMDIPTLQNKDKYPLMIGNACLTNKFDVSECFGEAMLRATNKGAIGYIGATDETNWDEDYYWAVGYKTVSVNPVYSANNLGAFDKLFHDHGEPFDAWHVTQGQIVYGGNLAVTQSGSSDYDLYWEMYHLMGDPSLMPYFSVPPKLTASYNSLIPLGSFSFTVTTEPFAYVAVSMNGVLHGAVLADTNGIAVIPIIPFTTSGIADIVATKQNRQPFISTVIVASPTGAHVLYKEHAIDDNTGNNNGLADFNEYVSLDVTLKNFGLVNDSTVSGKLLTADAFVTITDSTQYWGIIEVNDSSTQMAAFTLKVDCLITDQHSVLFNLVTSDSIGNNWTSPFVVTLNAPVFKIISLLIDDTGGNANGKLDPGETVDIIVITKNNGHADAINTVGVLSTTNSDVTINNSASYNFDTLSAGETDSAFYNITVNAAAVVGTYADLLYTVSSGPYNADETFNRGIGTVLEDFETGDFSKFKWVEGGDTSWIITDTLPYEGLYCAKSGNIDNSQESQLLIAFNVFIDDSISFYRKVSSEEDFDYLKFYMDNKLMGAWSGYKNWARVSYPVPAGGHTFKWTYIKDNTYDDYDDCAWIDYIIFPPSDTNATVLVVEKTDASASLNCYPNPFTDVTTISYTLTGETFISLKIYNVMGKEITTLLDKKQTTAGNYQVTFNASNLDRGIYYCVLNAGNRLYTRKLILIK